MAVAFSLSKMVASPSVLFFILLMGNLHFGGSICSHSCSFPSTDYYILIHVYDYFESICREEQKTCYQTRSLDQLSLSLILEIGYRRRKQNLKMKHLSASSQLFSPLLSMTLDCSISFSYRTKLCSKQSGKRN